MKYTEDLVRRSQEIIQKVKEAEKFNKPIDNLVKEQIAIMECHKDEFVKQAVNSGLDELEQARIEVQLCNNIKIWAQKIGLPVEKYDEQIKNIRIRILGEEAYKNLFEK